MCMYIKAEFSSSILGSHLIMRKMEKARSSKLLRDMGVNTEKDQSVCFWGMESVFVCVDQGSSHRTVFFPTNLRGLLYANNVHVKL